MVSPLQTLQAFQQVPSLTPQGRDIESKLQKLKLAQGQQGLALGQQQLQQGAASQQLQAAKFAGIIGKVAKDLPLEQRRPLLEQFSDVIGPFEEGDDTDEVLDQAVSVFEQMFGDSLTLAEQQKFAIEREKLELGRRKLQADLLTTAQELSNKNLFDKKDMINLNDKVGKLTADARKIHASAKALEGLSERASPASQLAAVFKFMKANDPTSTVRESEQGQVYEAQGAMRGFANRINKLLGEGGLDKKGFLDLVDTAKTMANEAVSSASTEVDSYLDVFPALTTDQRNNLRERVPESFEVRAFGEEGPKTFTLPNGVQVKRLD